jgi:hypothetical protein
VPPMPTGLDRQLALEKATHAGVAA